MQIKREEYEKKAREINDSIFGSDRKKSVKMMDAVKVQVDSSAKFALEKALGTKGISAAAKAAFVDLLKEQKDAINLLLVDESQKKKSAEMLTPIFGYKSAEFIDNFQDVFRKLQIEIQLNAKGQVAG